MGESNHTGDVKVLVVDDDRDALKTLQTLLSFDYDVIAVPSGGEAIEVVRTAEQIAVTVMDKRMPKMDGFTAAREIRKLSPLTKIILNSAYLGDINADDGDFVESLFACIEKAGPVGDLICHVRNAVEMYRLEQDSARLLEIAQGAYQMIGRSEVMKDVFRLIYRVARSDNKVMIRGESGTGKELVARAIHNASDRRAGPFVPFQCWHKSRDLVESELFGHVKWAFTDAKNRRIGHFEYADRGTIFLDEIGDLDLGTQAKLLRVLDTGEYQMLGSTDWHRTSARVICATNRNLEEMIAHGTFREDLYFRLKVVQIDVPPLRDRREDIPLLVEAFVERQTVGKGLPPRLIDPEAMTVFTTFDWRGNVRQVDERIKDLLLHVDSGVILAEDVRRVLEMKEPVDDVEGDDPGLAEATRQFRRNLVRSALARCGNNKNAAARALKVDPANLRRLVKELDIADD
ncbi:MAG: sigma-54 dependent transcriptional regulator [candidate division Zixibacteria bacterium]|nr:sigma-54 dependent transcriptional regulator [candidate division Zixibacteria bacterium]